VKAQIFHWESNGPRFCADAAMRILDMSSMTARARGLRYCMNSVALSFAKLS
jgi:hypothetical protein